MALGKSEITDSMNEAETSKFVIRPVGSQQGKEDAGSVMCNMVSAPPTASTAIITMR